MKNRLGCGRPSIEKSSNSLDLKGFVLYSNWGVVVNFIYLLTRLNNVQQRRYWMVQKKEKVSINGVKIENLLDKAFMEKIIKELSEEVSPISIVFVKKPNNHVCVK